jgi:hypothetical protein
MAVWSLVLQRHRSRKGMQVICFKNLVKLVGGVMPLAVGGAMPLGGDGGVILPYEVDGTTLLQGDDGHDGPTLL